MSRLVSASGTTSENLLNAVRALAAQGGATELSSRALAEHAGVSASAVNYTFGSLDALLHAANTDSDRRRAAAWSEQSAALSELQVEKGDLASILFAVSREMSVRLSGENALFWTDVIQAARLSQPVEVRSGLVTERTYWATLLKACGLETVKPEIVQAFSLALRFAYLVIGVPERFDPWAMSLSNRFAGRLAGQPSNCAEDSAFRQRAEALASISDETSPPSHATAQLILRTTVRTILEEGGEADTFREIARRAGLSVSSVQHFFGSKRAYLIAAFQSIYATVRDRTVKDVPEANSLTVSEMAQLLASRDDATPKLLPEEFAAIQGLILSASRDEETRIIAAGLIARAGQTSQSVLRALKAPRGQIGRLDAQILSLTLTQFVTLEIAGLVSESDVDMIPALAEHLLTVLFA